MIDKPQAGTQRSVVSSTQSPGEGELIARFSRAELADIVACLGGRFRTQPFTANQRLALRMRLEAIVSEQEEADGRG